MNVFRKSSNLLPCLLVMLLIAVSCSNPEKKAKEYVDKLGKNEKVLSMNLTGDKKEIIALVNRNDSMMSAVSYSLDTEKIDTIASVYNFAEVCDILSLDSCYMVITRTLRPDSNYHYLYNAYIVRNSSNPEAKTIHELLVDKTRENLKSSGYVIDKERNLLTLSSYETDDNKVTIYHTVYDFDGNQIVEDPLDFNLITQVISSDNGSASYLWECQYCGEKRNSPKNPGPWEFTCHGRGEREGFGNSHYWVKIGRVD